MPSKEEQGMSMSKDWGSVEEWRTAVATEIARYELSGGKEGERPEWVETIHIARFLVVAPWELGGPQVKREVWRERAQIFIEAGEIVNATLRHQQIEAHRQQQAAAGLLVPSGSLRA